MEHFSSGSNHAVLADPGLVRTPGPDVVLVLLKHVIYSLAVCLPANRATWRFAVSVGLLRGVQPGDRSRTHDRLQLSVINVLRKAGSIEVRAEGKWVLSGVYQPLARCCRRKMSACDALAFPPAHCSWRKVPVFKWSLTPSMLLDDGCRFSRPWTQLVYWTLSSRYDVFLVSGRSFFC
ncbi:uncharacterized protein LOC132382980 isoform X2 [Hypanus sabinus]|uniref:uncharacterized protein LOC132382980 isoform X2 n=1 Tax=Hypanus sabinus TaxID=79690 RepID=UPI0028C46970|nr:uncharacterized protein LOC132382980 isoform X2 [Hypanus sabinus]